MILYEDDNLFVVANGIVSPDLVITFSNWTNSSERVPLWEKNIAKLGIKGIFFVAKWNHWYQNPSTYLAISTIQSILKDHQNICTMGSSVSYLIKNGISPKFSNKNSLGRFHAYLKELRFLT